MSHHLMENLTYARHLKNFKKNSIPCQAVCNMVEISKLPKEFRHIQRLEWILMARQPLFKKISLMSKGQSAKLKGTLCNVPIDVVDIFRTLPCSADSNGIVIVKQIDRPCPF